MDISRVTQMAAGRLTVRSALNPFLWLCGIVSVPCFAMAATFRSDRPLMWVLLLLGALPLVITSIVAVRFGFRAPEKLQSEDYQLRHQSLQMLQGVDGGQIIDSVAVVAIANPALPGPPHAPVVREGERE